MLGYNNSRLMQSVPLPYTRIPIGFPQRVVYKINCKTYVLQLKAKILFIAYVFLLIRASLSPLGARLMLRLHIEPLHTRFFRGPLQP